jgi:hypothetical protein
MIKKVYNHYVYKIVDPETGEYYIGCRSCNCNIEQDSYMGSYSTWKPTNCERLQKYILKSDFSNRDDAMMYEAELIKEHIDNTLNRNYHIPGVGFHTQGAKLSDETKEKLRFIALSRPPRSEETRKKLSHAMKGKMAGEKNPMYGKYGKLSPSYGREVSDETRKKLSDATKAHFENMTNEEYDKFVETMRNAVLGEKNPFYGKKHTEESKKKMSESHPYPMKGKSYEEFYGKSRSDEMKERIRNGCINKKKLKCPYCEKETDPGNAKQWHFDKCKYKIK